MIKKIFLGLILIAVVLTLVGFLLPRVRGTASYNPVSLSDAVIAPAGPDRCAMRIGDQLLAE